MVLWMRDIVLVFPVSHSSCVRCGLPEAVDCPLDRFPHTPVWGINYPTKAWLIYTRR